MNRFAPRVLAIVQAGGQGSRMDVLTRERAKPALPFAGDYQLIDFTLSALSSSGISDVWIAVQYQASSLDPHLAGGRPWDLDRTRGGYRRIVPEEGGAGAAEGFAQGNADHLVQLMDDIAAFDPDVLVVSSADHVCNPDLRGAIATHLDRGAECTMISAQVPRAEAAHKAVLTVNKRSRVTAFAYKPERAPSTTVATEIFLYDPKVLVRTLGELRAELSRAAAQAAEANDEAAGSDSGLGDFGEHLLPRLVKGGKVFAHPVDGYWRDVGRPEAYLRAHRDLLGGRMDVFRQPGRPVLTRFTERPPAQVTAGAQISDSLLSPGACVQGTVINSVIGPGTVVRPGARVENSVLFRDVMVERDAVVRTAIVDAEVVIGARASVGGTSRRPGDDDITLVGKQSRVRRGATIRKGARLEAGTTG